MNIRTMKVLIRLNWKFCDIFRKHLQENSLYILPEGLNNIESIRNKWLKHRSINFTVMQMRLYHYTLKVEWNNLTTLIVREDKNELLTIIYKEKLPPLLKSLSLISNTFNDYIWTLPTNLERLILFCPNYNKNLQGLPQGLLYFELNSRLFDGSLNRLPSSIKTMHLKLAKKLISECEKPAISWPSSLVKLKFEGHSKTYLRHLIHSKNLRKLELRGGFTLPFECLPTELEKLTIVSSNFNNTLEYIPIGLKKLRIYSKSFHQTISLAHTKLECIVIHSGNDYNSLPKETICYTDNDISILCNSYVSDQPKGLFNNILDDLPETLQHLTIHSNYFNQSVDKLPKYLRYLSIYSPEFNQPYKKLPPLLETLEISSRVLTHKPDSLPADLKVLQCNFSPTQSIDSCTLQNLPRNLLYLNLNSIRFAGNMCDLPRTLVSFSFSNKQWPSISLHGLPPNLKHLYIWDMTGYLDLSTISNKVEQLYLKGMILKESCRGIPDTIQKINVLGCPNRSIVPENMYIRLYGYFPKTTKGCCELNIPMLLHRHALP